MSQTLSSTGAYTLEFQRKYMEAMYLNVHLPFPEG